MLKPSPRSMGSYKYKISRVATPCSYKIACALLNLTSEFMFLPAFSNGVGSNPRKHGTETLQDCPILLALPFPAQWSGGVVEH
jgi:hypothetical protein